MKSKLYTFILYLTEKTVYLLYKEEQIKFVREITNILSRIIQDTLYIGLD